MPFDTICRNGGSTFWLMKAGAIKGWNPRPCTRNMQSVKRRSATSHACAVRLKLPRTINPSQDVCANWLLRLVASPKPWLVMLMPARMKLSYPMMPATAPVPYSVENGDDVTYSICCCDNPVALPVRVKYNCALQGCGSPSKWMRQQC